MIRYLRLSLFFLLGVIATLGQVLLIRQFLAVAYGNELCLGLYFFWWFLGVGSGAIVGGKTAERVRDPLWWLISLLAIFCLVFLVQLGVIRGLRYFLRVDPGEYLSLGQLAVGAALGVIPFSFLIGLIFPFAGQVARSKERSSPGDVSLVYILEAAGSLVIGLLFTYLFLHYLSPYSLVKFTAVILVAAGTLLYFLHWRKQRGADIKPVRLLVLISILIFLLLFPAGKIERSTMDLRWRSGFPGLKRIESRESPYGQLDLAEREGQYSLYSNGQLVETFPDPYTYLEPVHCALVQHASPEKVLLVGGSPEMIRLVLAHGVKRVDWVELDPVLLDLMLSYVPEEDRALLKDTRIRIFHQDGRRFIQETRGSYDLILLNVPDPSTAGLNRYYTREFYEAVQGALNPDGVLVTAIRASVHVTGEEILGYGRVIYSTLSEVFPVIALQPGQTYSFYACQMTGQVTEDPEVMAARFRERKIEPDSFAFMFESLYPPDRVQELRSGLTGPGPSRINTDFRPVAYLYQLILWNRWAGSHLSGLLLFLKDQSPLWMLGVPLIWIGLRFAVTRKKEKPSKERFDLAMAILVIGLTGMSVELILLFGFQNVFGVLYQNIALFIALFMLGLTLGASGARYLTERPWFKSGKQRRALLMAVLLALLVLVNCLPGCMEMASGKGSFLFYLLAGVSGILTGMGFPIAISLYHKEGEPVSRAAGMIDSMDHLGAMIGALLTGALWLPLWGVWVTCGILAGANLMALLFLRR